jgi:UDP-glucuronate 4-epimerase
MTHALVTGAAGFVGSAVVEALLARPGIRVSATCRSVSEALRDLAGKHSALTVLADIDLAEPAAVAALPGDVTHVVHAAAVARFQGVAASELERSNVLATQRLLDWARQSARTLQRFLHVSTFGVHDRPRFGGARRLLDETAPRAPTSRYGETKLQAERRVRLSGLPHVIARLPWVYGPRMRTDSHIRVLAEMCRRGHPVTRLDLPGRVSVAEVGDLASALDALLFKRELAHDTYLVAHATPVRLGRMFALFHEALGRPATLRRVDWARPFVQLAAPALPMQLRSMFEDYYACDVSRLAAEGIRLATAFDHGIRTAVAEGRWFER